MKYSCWYPRSDRTRRCLAPSVRIVDPGAMVRCANSTNAAEPASGETSIRTLPSLRPGIDSTATIAAVLSLTPPALPRVSLPMNTSSSSTTPDSWSRSGRTMARRSLCIHAHAVSYEPKPRTRCSPSAETPFFWLVMNQTAANQVDSGVRVRWKIVPAVTEVCRPQSMHIHRAFAVRQYRLEPHAGNTNPTRPTQARQVVQARRVVREPGQQLLKRLRIVNAPNRMRLDLFCHAPIILYLSGYPVLVFESRHNTADTLIVNILRSVHATATPCRWCDFLS